MTAGALAPAVLRAAKPGSAGHVAVIGAGVFGAWTAEHLRRAGHRVTLVDMAGPANNRASSGGESRMTRAAYGKDEIYSRMARDSLAEWKALSAPPACRSSCRMACCSSPPRLTIISLSPWP